MMHVSKVGKLAVAVVSGLLCCIVGSHTGAERRARFGGRNRSRRDNGDQRWHFVGTGHRGRGGYQLVRRQRDSFRYKPGRRQRAGVEHVHCQQHICGLNRYGRGYDASCGW
jgi:hypothetical protein